MVDPGGLRDRFIEQSLFEMIHAALSDAGWLSPHPSRLNVTVVDEPVDIHTQIVPNVVSLCSENVPVAPAMMGSETTVDTHDFYLDVFAEDDSVGQHLAGDLRAILSGQMPSVSRTRPTLDVYDYSLATPSVAFACDIDNVTRHRAHDFPHPWLAHWFSVAFSVVDEQNDVGA